MTENNITPPPELVQQWMGLSQALAIAAAFQAGADQELEACCKWLSNEILCESNVHRYLRAARRPKPPSLKEQALAAMDEMEIEPCIIEGVDVTAAIRAKYGIIRRALEQLND